MNVTEGNKIIIVFDESQLEVGGSHKRRNEKGTESDLILFACILANLE